jgi:hypothetical protein
MFSKRQPSASLLILQFKSSTGWPTVVRQSRPVPQRAHVGPQNPVFVFRAMRERKSDALVKRFFHEVFTLFPHRFRFGQHKAF